MGLILDVYHMNLTISAMKRIRTPLIREELTFHSLIKIELLASHIGYEHEVKLASRNRIDFLTEHGIGIEVKKGKPNELQVLKQLSRYATFPEVKGIILVIERYMDLPNELNGKPCISIGLNKLWGIAN